MDAIMRLLVVSSALVACLHATSLANAQKVTKIEMIPPVRRVEGRVTLVYSEDNKRIKNQLAFTEVADDTTKRSKVTIGHVSYVPNVYHTRGKTVMTVSNVNKRCNKLPESNMLLPELDFFVKNSYTEKEFADEMAWYKADCHSPTAILLMNINKPRQYDSEQIHRSTMCNVFRSTYRRTKSDIPIKFDILVPKMTSVDGNSAMPFFTVRESVDGIAKPDGLGKYSTLVVIDFFYIETIDKKDPMQLAKLEEELSLPLGKGCSQYLKEIVPSTPTVQSFVMTYAQSSNQALVSLAYDHESGYLRKELHGQSVAIWDLNEDLLYHLDKSLTGKLHNANLPDVNVEQCSVLSFQDLPTREPKPVSSNGPPMAEDSQDQGGRALVRPYEKAGQSLDVLKFMGADKIFYMGQATARGLPSMVFETMLAEPPKIFQVDIRDYGQMESYEYIVQFHVFKITKPDDDGAKQDAANKSKEKPASEDTGLPIKLDRFWPAKINLYARHKETAWVHLLESLDVQDFHWGLYGWQGKPSELFMMPECFDDDDEQLRIELSLNFQQKTPVERQSLMAHKKYKLELDLETDLFNLFGISRLHLTEYRLTLGRHNLVANLVVSDRKDEKKLSFFGEGLLPSADSYKDHRMLLELGAAKSSLDNCVMTAAHIDAISMVVYCPGNANDQAATCEVIWGESEAEIRILSGEDSSDGKPRVPTTTPVCEVYRFEPSKPPKPVSYDYDRFKHLLDDHEFTFRLNDEPYMEPSDERRAESVVLKVEDYDVTREQQLITINSYKFDLTDLAQSTGSTEPEAGDKKQSPQANVRFFPSVTYDTLGDCSRMCNLDSSCKSFSYCSKKAASDGKQCLLSSLDLRKNNVELQLVRAVLDDNMQLTIVDQDLIKRQNETRSSVTDYRFSLKTGCNIYERDFLSLFTRTEEFLRVNTAVAHQHALASSPTECARFVVGLEEQDSSHHVAAFAYCAHTGACLSDENMFVQIKGIQASSLAEEDDSTDIQNELSCQMFRKRYQSYFHVSPTVVKKPVSTELKSNKTGPTTMSGGLQQIELALNTVEECARACWDTFGHVCVSFDYCTPRECFINAAGSLSTESSSTNTRYEPNKVEYESVENCLGYKRDLKYDQLRREHLVGKHQLLIVDPNAPEVKGSSHGNGGWFVTILMLCGIVVLFDVGLVIGQNFNDRWDNTSGTRRSSPTESTLNFTRFLRANGSSRNGHTTRIDERMSSLSKFNIENEIYEDANAIRMDELGNGSTNSTTTSTGGDTDDQPASSGPTFEDKVGDLLSVQDEEPRSRSFFPAATKRSTTRRPDYIDVPELL